MSRGVANALFLLLFFAFAFLHLYRLGVVTYTWDEGSDLGIVSCLQRTHDPFVCLDDISQTRLPFYIHAIAHTPRSQYLISAAFSLFNFVVIYAFARRELGRLTATLTAALFATSPALLASGRMLLTHSNVIFTTFTLLSFLTLKEYANGGGPSPRDAGRGWRAAPGEGRHSGSLRHAPRPRAATLPPGPYPVGNVLGLGSSRAPWYFPFLILAVKVGPWLLFLPCVPWRKRFAVAFFAGFFIDLLLKGFVFHYEAP